jgi:hypothetical protein
MPETEEQYRDRLAGYVNNQDPLHLQRQTLAKLNRLLDSASSEQLALRPAPGKWSTVEILAHLAEDELVTSWRYRQMLQQDGVALAGFDQELWARLGDYQNWNAREAFGMFRLLREANLRMLAALSPEQWERSGNHAERGRITLRDLAHHMAAHDINHLKQVDKLLVVEG